MLASEVTIPTNTCPLSDLSIRRAHSWIPDPGEKLLRADILAQSCGTASREGERGESVCVCVCVGGGGWIGG
jgi:hypothetical protein